MTETGRVRQRRRPFLFVVLFLATIWAAWWLWPDKASKPDFSVSLSPNGSELPVAGPQGVLALNPPLYREGRFYAAGGKQIGARYVVRDEREGNVDAPSFVAIFRLEPGGTRADIQAAAKQIWAICDVAVYVPTAGQEYVAPLFPTAPGKDCDDVFGARHASSGVSSAAKSE